VKWVGALASTSGPIKRQAIVTEVSKIKSKAAANAAAAYAALKSSSVRPRAAAVELGVAKEG
jgi:hypothetical protein